MKHYSLFIFATVMLVSPACKKEPNATVQKGITYPESVYYGKNILSFADSVTVNKMEEYEFGATLEKDAKLTIVLTNYSDTSGGHLAIWTYNSETGWAIADYDEAKNSQKFISSSNGKISLKMVFLSSGKPGKCKMDIYENSETVTKTKYLFW